MAADENLEEKLDAPKIVVTDEGKIEERSADELIKGDKYVDGSKVTKPPYGMRIARINHLGTVYPPQGPNRGF